MKLPKGSRLLVWMTIAASFALSADLRDATAVTVVVPFALGLYANRQYQDTRKEKLNT